MVKISEKNLAATVIRTEIERLAEAEKQKAEEQSQGGDELDSTPSMDHVSTSDFKRVVFGSRLPSLSIETLEGLRRDDLTFQKFRGKLGSTLTRLLDCPRVTLQASYAVRPTTAITNLINDICFQITPFQFIIMHP